MATDTLAIPPKRLASPATPGPARVACAHCTLDVPSGLVDHAHPDSPQFCCQGCRAAFEVIQGCGLERYYALRSAATGDNTTGAAPRPVALTPPDRFAAFDDPAFAARYVKPATPASLHADLLLEGVHCAACVWLVERLPRIVPGLIEARLDFRRSLVSLTWDPSRVPLSRIASALHTLGYTPHPARQGAARDIRERTDRRMLAHLAVAGACAGNVMLLAFALYAGAFDGMEPLFRQAFRWLSMGITVISLAWPGRVFFTSAIAALRTRTLHLDVPIAVGLAAGAVAGVANTLRGHGEIYFDSLAVLVFALLVGRFIQHRQQRAAADAVELLFSFTPSSARRVGTDGSVRQVALESIRTGDLIEVLAGDAFPVDGRIVHGTSDADNSLLTGEADPVPVAPGDAVAAGATNLTSTLRIVTHATGEATRMGRLMRAVAEASSRRAPIVRMADAVAARFVIAAITLAAITVVIWWPTSPWRALDQAAALLVVTCPCAVGLATPLAMTIAIGRAARCGFFIKGADALERLARPGSVILDKTGTITEGRARVHDTRGDSADVHLAASLAAHSSHPVARALARTRPANAPTHDVSGVYHTLGRGLSGTVQGRAVTIGSPSHLRSIFGPLPEHIEQFINNAASRALTPVVIAIDGHPRAAVALGDAIRPGTARAITRLRRAGWAVSLLSGDHPDAVTRVAASLGIAPAQARGGASPEEKLHAVEHATPRPVVMVGDGVNDAAALAAAGVGIAVHGGAEASIAAADIYLTTPGLGSIADLFASARRTISLIKRGIAISILYNATGATLAISGMISPLIAAILMPLSSFTVLALAVRGRTFDPPGAD